MTTRTYEITANDVLMGEYRASSIEAALDAFARDAGYEDFADALENVPSSTRDEVYVEEVDTDLLIAAVEEATSEAAFQDSYGSGVVLVKGESYPTYRALAEAFGLDLADFYTSRTDPTNFVFVVQQGDEDLPEGDFSTLEAARSGMHALERDLGWRGLRIVRRIEREIDGVMSITGREVVEYGLSIEDDE